jgi:hypothetical protein
MAAFLAVLPGLSILPACRKSTAEWQKEMALAIRFG